eukprot:gene15501-20920_t
MNGKNLKDIIKASYKGTNEADKKIGQNLGYKLNRDLSNRKQKVVLDKDNKPLVAFIGTRTFGDIITNGALAIGLGGFTNRFQHSKRVIDNVRKKYNKPITIVGHSLGGSLAEHAGGDKVITIDKGVGIFGIGKKIKSNQTDIRIANDPVSLLSLTQQNKNRITIPKTYHIILSPLKSHEIPTLEIPSQHQIYLSVKHANIPYSFYNIDAANNALIYTQNGTITTLNIEPGNKLYNSISKDISSVPKVSSNIEDNTGNTKDSIYAPTGVLKKNTYNNKKSYLEKR